MHIKKSLPTSTIIVSAIAIFGLISSTILISVDLTDAQYASVAYIANALVTTNGNSTDKDHSDENQDFDHSDNPITVITSPLFSWIYIYVFDANHIFTHDRDTQPITTQKIMLLVDSTYKHVISGVEGENATQVNRLKNIYNNTDIVALFKDDSSKFDREIYPYRGLDSASIGSATQEIRTN